jgi:mono/diheme cytochrome c family protein
MSLKLGAGFLVLMTLLSGTAFAAGDPARGLLLAKTWCASCHLVTADQASASTEAPAFGSIAKRPSGELDALAGFLADPHPPMPNLSLTRDEIRDLLAYIGSLR